MNIIDIHTHGIGGFDTRSDSVEHVLKIAHVHGSLGYLDWQSRFYKKYPCVPYNKTNNPERIEDLIKLEKLISSGVTLVDMRPLRTAISLLEVIEFAKF